MRLDIGVVKMSNIIYSGFNWILKSNSVAGKVVYILQCRKNGYAPLIVSFNIQPSKAICEVICYDYIRDLSDDNKHTAVTVSKGSKLYVKDDIGLVDCVILYKGFDELREIVFNIINSDEYNGSIKA